MKISVDAGRIKHNRKEKKLFEYMKNITGEQRKQHNTEQKKTRQGGHDVRHVQDKAGQTD